MIPDFVQSTVIPEVKVITPRKFSDYRGFFSEVYNREALRKAGVDLEFVQDNHSLSVQAGTVRGLHFQSPPFAQDKLIRVTKGRIFDVVVDIRRGAATYGRHICMELSAENWCQLLVPVGFAHGFCSLEPNTEVLYKVTQVYSATHDCGLAWDDPDLGINWPVDVDQAILSESDKGNPRLRDLTAYFA